MGPLRDAERDSVFVAAMPPPASARRLAAYAARQKLGLGLPGEIRPPATLHVTLARLGSAATLSPARIAGAKQALASIERCCFTVDFDRLQGFSGATGKREGKFPVVLCGSDGVFGLCGLHDAVQQALGRKPERTYTPHMTLLYVRERIPERPLDTPLTWSVGEIVLVHSLYGLSEYRFLGRWPLRKPAAGYRERASAPSGPQLPRL